MWNLALEFPKCLPFPWKQCKKVKMLQKLPGLVNNFGMLELKIIKFLYNIVVHYIQVLNDYDNHWNYSVTMDTGSNISKISKCSKIDET